jgi:Fe2+ transport system protein FeoA
MSKEGVVKLTEMEVGKEGKVTFIVPASRRRLEHLLILGVTQGSTLKLVQKRPAFVLALGELTLAMGREIADGIYVRPSGHHFDA